MQVFEKNRDEVTANIYWVKPATWRIEIQTDSSFSIRLIKNKSFQEVKTIFDKAINSVKVI